MLPLPLARTDLAPVTRLTCTSSATERFSSKVRNATALPSGDQIGSAASSSSRETVLIISPVNETTTAFLRQGAGRSRIKSLPRNNPLDASHGGLWGKL